MPKRPTIRDVAKQAGVSHITVSRALRKQSCVQKETQEKIVKIAKEMGYRPDPALSALMAYRKGAKPTAFNPVIAWINSNTDPQTLYHHGGFKLYHLGASQRCEELGYRLEEFRLADLKMSYRRLSKVLYTRNIIGVLFAPQQRHNSHISEAAFDWSKFSIISFGFSLKRPRLHIVTNAQYRTARLAMQKLRAKGYRRIGCVTWKVLEERSDWNFLSGYLIEQERFLGRDRVPICYMHESDQRKCFLDWMTAYKPDAILDIHNVTPWVLTAEEQRKLSIAHLNVPEQSIGELAGIHQNGRLIGRAAVDEVVAMIHANERGIPKIPRFVFIEGRWVDGASVPRLNK